MSGPSYLFCGSRLTDDTLLLRALLEGLNTQGRQWSEKITILDDGTLRNIEEEVSFFRNLEYQPLEPRDRPNIVVAFMDRLSHNRNTEDTLERAETQGIPAFIISRYGGQKFPP